MKTIFAVDDTKLYLDNVERALQDRFYIQTFSSVMRMFVAMEKKEPDLILMDILMPEMDGFAAIKIIKAHDHWKHIPVIFITAHENPETEVMGFNLGADDFILKPFSDEILNRRVDIILNFASIIQKQVEKITRVQNSVINVITNLIESRDEVTGYHINRTSKYLEVFIKKMMEMRVYREELFESNIPMLISSARMHDLGKISISDTILNKPGKLTTDEFEIIKTHTIKGEKILNEIMSETGTDEFLQNAKLFASSHHEKWNGTGYPKGLGEYSIPLFGRILAIADVYDALISERPYKKPMNHGEAVKTILEGAGTHFDPKLVKVFAKIESESK
jgi:putative two-component system response regulator